MDKVRKHLIISGRVQGVFFRSSTQDKAASLGLSGWVRNTSDGKVEAVFEGDREAVDEMISWCHKGPSPASVDKVRISEEAPSGELQRFVVKR
jgi:acylphosphatase